MAPAKSFTPKQGLYLAFIYAYTRLHRRPKPTCSNISGSGGAVPRRFHYQRHRRKTLLIGLIMRISSPITPLRRSRMKVLLSNGPKHTSNICFNEMNWESLSDHGQDP
jgi:hypothetical protein